MIVTTSNRRNSSSVSYVRFISCEGHDSGKIELHVSNVKRTVKKDPELFRELVEVAKFVNSFGIKNDMLKMFRECKAQSDVMRYFNDMERSAWSKTQHENRK